MVAGSLGEREPGNKTDSLGFAKIERCFVCSMDQIVVILHGRPARVVLHEVPPLGDRNCAAYRLGYGVNMR
jgi:hypothetical protein